MCAISLPNSFERTGSILGRGGGVVLIAGDVLGEADGLVSVPGVDFHIQRLSLVVRAQSLAGLSVGWRKRQAHHTSALCGAAIVIASERRLRSSRIRLPLRGTLR